MEHSSVVWRDPYLGIWNTGSSLVHTVLLSPNSVLSLLAEEEGRGKVLVCQNTRNKGGVVDVLGEVVSMNKGNEPPDNTKTKPGEDEAGNECKEDPAPLHVNHGGENILRTNLMMVIMMMMTS